MQQCNAMIYMTQTMLNVEMRLWTHGQSMSSVVQAGAGCQGQGRYQLPAPGSARRAPGRRINTQPNQTTKLLSQYSVCCYKAVGNVIFK